MNATTLDLTLQQELSAAARGDTRAYGRVVLACQNTVTAIALAITRDRAASEDIAQEAFLKAWQQLHRLHSASSFLPWLRQITRNLARDYLRANRNRPLSGEGAEIAIGMAADPSPSPGERLLLTEEEIVATEIISALPEDSRETLLLYYREGQSSQQVAALLGLSDAAVRKRLSRARSSVREDMLRRFGDFASSTAPGAAFAMVVVGGLVGATPAASAATVIGSGLLGGGLGKLGGSGIAAGGAAGGVAGGSMGMMIENFTQSSAAMGGVIGGVIGGLVGYGLTWWYLTRFCQSAADRHQVKRFMLLNSATGATWVFVLMLSSLLVSQVPVVAAFLLGIAVINYQYLVTLPRIMDPMLAHPANARRRHGYRFFMGREAMIVSTMLATAAVAWALMNSGNA